MKTLVLTDEEHGQLLEYLKGRREVDGDSMDEDSLVELDHLIEKVEAVGWISGPRCWDLGQL